MRPSVRWVSVPLVVAACAWIACGKPPEPPPEPDFFLTAPVQPDLDRTMQGAVAATIAASPTSPLGDDGASHGWTTAPQLTPVSLVRNRDSVLILLPVVDGARDYRAFTVPAGTQVDVDGDGTEKINGTTIFCAGYRQFNAEATNSLTLLRMIEVTGVAATTRIVIEAIDKPCPFAGVMGRSHQDIQAINSVLKDHEKVTFQVFTEAEIRARYGSLIINGHAPAGTLGAPAELHRPKVLARTTVAVTPLDRSSPKTATFFDDFLDNGDQPTFVSTLPTPRNQRGKRFANSKWNFYAYGAVFADFFIDRGQLHFLNADWAQDIFSTLIAYPKRPAQLSGTTYLHVTFDVPTNATARRYWWFFLCGSNTAGQTMEADGTLKGTLIQESFFYQPDGHNPSLEKWNCLQMFPRDGWPFSLPPNNQRPQTDVRVMVNIGGAESRESVRNVSPVQYANANIGPPGWYRQQTAGGTLTAPMLDDQLHVAQKTKYDLYIRRDRVVMLVNGEQRLCNDFPGHALTMADAAVGFGQVLYHSAAERLEFSVDFWKRTGQRYYLSNTPFIDSRAWDNVGYEEGVSAPSGFDPATCYVHP